MKFKNKFSNKQNESIFWIIVGFIALFVTINSNVIKGIGLFIIGISILNLIDESIKRYKIIHPYKTNRYDSQAEEKIANYFQRKNIIYYHHPQLKLPKLFLRFLNIPFLNFRLEPDFFLPEFNVFVEYWGLIDNKEYKEKNYDFKKEIYKNNSIDLISLYPKNLENLDYDFTSRLLEVIKEREGNSRIWR